MYDILIRQAKIVDGTGQAPYVADLGIIADRIAWIGVADAANGESTGTAAKTGGSTADMGGPAADARGSVTDTEGPVTDAGGSAAAWPQRSARRIIEAKGMVLAPGFVDMHSHSDCSLLIDNRAESKLRQGVTTEVVGNCGYSAAPLYSPLIEERRPEYEGIYGLSLDWRTFPEYLKRVEASSPSINYAFLIGHNTLRASAMGFGDQPPSPDQMARMRTWVEEALDCGAFGLSTGLYYAPACFARKEELIQLAGLVGHHNGGGGGILTSHIRNEGKGLFGALEEILTIAREAKVPLQISHLKTFGKENWWKLDQALEMIETARQQEEVTFDRYPYLAVQTSLQSLLPDWAQAGGSEAIVQRILDPSVRSKIVHYLLTEYPDEDYWASIYISLVAGEANKQCEGLNIVQLAESLDKSPVEAGLDLLQEERTQVEIVQFAMSEKNLARILRHPLAMIGSDSSSRAVDGPLRIGKPHPRAFGTFPRLIREFCFEKGILSLEEGVRKMTALPCQKLGLKDRGIIREGMIADLLLFDPERIADQATYQDPFRYPEGIRLVVVNGRICLEEDGSIHTGQGRILQRR